ncbi:helix-turn-helix domain-containing protein [Brevibacillus sp. SYP-B805]|uniref:helix-turn-helix domain-containing protein n=1 Tax=Brevibacillus sp. SYP-B805 TaxID=1578199 RepID=UPI0013E9BB0D|nr:XRE family transcriptional regulator [Brevibacillus sp. SYP-B805]NGQ93703.1 helix-turn-helix domain-containing protein [Brevibacillus sp. SYP-B805]
MRLPIEMIGNKIRMIRKERGFTLETMANKTGLSKGLLSQVERGISQPSLDSLWRITRALDSSIIHFFEDVNQKHVHLTRKEKRKQVIFPESSGTYSLLSAGSGGKLGLMEVRLQPGDTVCDQFIQQDGEECLVIIRGSVIVRVGEEVHQLQAGDSLYFASSQNRTVENAGDEEAVLVWALTPPQF